MNNKDLVLPMTIPFRDDVELIRNILEVFSVTMALHDKTKKLTNRNIDLISLCILYGINNKEIRKIGVDSGIFNTPEQINTEFSRLKKKGLIQKHAVYNERSLSGGLEYIERLVKNKDKGIRIVLGYEKI